jgi:hypothetical protein
MFYMVCLARWKNEERWINPRTVVRRRRRPRGAGKEPASVALDPE